MRARNLKPGFFKNPELAELPCEARLLFAGLWCMADKAGRLEDRPRKIKIEVFPADTFEVEPLLEALEGKRLILRYTVDGAAFIQVVNFEKHQNPHKTEAESRIPPPPGYGDFTELQPLDNGTRPADSLIPDSLIPSLRSEPARRPSRKAPRDFVVSSELRAAMSSECPGVDLERETAKFMDHTFGTARVDWDGTWRNWIRKAAEIAAPRGQQSPAVRADARAIAIARIKDHAANIQCPLVPRETEPAEAYETRVKQWERENIKPAQAAGKFGIGALAAAKTVTQ